MTTPTIIIADDDASICTVLERAITKHGMRAQSAQDASVMLDWIRAGKGDVLVTDVMMPHGGKSGSNLELLPEIKQLRPDLPVIVISARNTLMTAVKAAERGAFEYLPKPFDLNTLLATIDKALSIAPAQTAEITKGEALENAGLIGRSPAMQEIYRLLARLVSVDLTVMVTGESGTGKELIARALHGLSKRRNFPFVAVNMAAIPKELVESELFGHEKGAFTGAQTRKAGTFEQAEGGTVFLDEIGDMPLEAQTRLLRVLQQGEYIPVGGTKTQKTNVRIICATHRDLMQRVASGEFREDLYYRLNVVPLRVPPLHERADDIEELAQYFLRRAKDRGMGAKTLDVAVLRLLKAHRWPGNVRELENLMYRLAALSPGHAISAQAVEAELTQSSPQQTTAPGSIANCMESSVREHLQRYFDAHGDELPPPGMYDRILPLLERPLIEFALMATSGNQVKAATLLGINRNTLRKRMGELGIDAEVAANIKKVS